MMTGYIHTVYPRASVSMKMGSPLKVVGVLDTDVSTGVAGRLGPGPDMLPVEVRVQAGHYAEPHTVPRRDGPRAEPDADPGPGRPEQRHRHRGEPAEELTAHVSATIRLKDRAPITLADTYSGPRYSGPMGPAALFGPVAQVVGLMARNPMAPVRIEAITCDVTIDSGRRLAEVETVRLASDRLQPGQTLRASRRSSPSREDRQDVALELPLPADLPEGLLRGRALRRVQQPPAPVPQRARAAGAPRPRRRPAGRPLPDRAAAHRAVPARPAARSRPVVRGQPLPNLPGSVRAVFATGRQTLEPPVKADLIQDVETSWVVEGTQALKVHRGQGRRPVAEGLIHDSSADDRFPNSDDPKRIRRDAIGRRESVIGDRTRNEARVPRGPILPSGPDPLLPLGGRNIAPWGVGPSRTEPLFR
jgi:hypothetical protein